MAVRQLIRVGFAGLFAGFLLFSCSGHRSEDVIPRDQMTDILYDYHLAQAMGNSFVGKDNYERFLYKESVFAKYGITEAQFDSSMVWYTRHTTVLAEIYKEVAERMKAEKKKVEHLVSLRDNRPVISERGDSVDVWAWSRMFRLTQSRLDNLYTFVLPSDSNFRSTDRLVWEADLHLLPQKGLIPDSAVIMQMLIHYECDSVISHTLYLGESGRRTIELQNDTLGNIRDVAGMVYILPDSTYSAVVMADSICLYRYRVKTDRLQSDSVKSEKANTNAVRQIKLEREVKMPSDEKKSAKFSITKEPSQTRDTVKRSVSDIRTRQLQVQRMRERSEGED